MKDIKSQHFCFVLLFAGLLLVPDIAFAQLGTVKSTLESIQTALTAISLITVTLAILYVGYKVLFGGQSFKELSPVIIGAIVIASAAEIAKLLIG